MRRLPRARAADGASPFPLNPHSRPFPSGRLADDVDREDRGEAAGRGHCSGTPAFRRPSKMDSSWARYVGSSLIAVQAARAREMEKAGSSARPALTAERASSSRPSCARAAPK